METYMIVNAQAMFRNGGNGPWRKTARGCLACMHGHGAGMGASHAFCYVNAFQRTTALQGVEGFAQAVGAATATLFSQIQVVGPPLYFIYRPFPHP